MDTPGGNGFTGESRSRVLAGLALLFPAILCCAGGLVLPTVITVFISLSDMDIHHSLIGRSQFVGLENYQSLFQNPAFSSAVSFTLLMAVVRVLVVTAVPPLLALAVNEFGRRVRIPVRLLLTVPLALFAPAVTAWAWRGALSPQAGFLAAIAEGIGLTSRRAVLLAVDGLTTFGLASGVGLVFYLTALRSSDGEVSSWRRVRLPLGASWAVGLLATVALALQSFAMGAPDRVLGGTEDTQTLWLWSYRSGLLFGDFGYASAAATLVSAVVMGLGLIAGLLVVFAGLRLEIVPKGRRSGLFGGEGGSGRGRTAAVVLLGVTLLVSLGGCTAGVVPRLWSALISLKSEAQIDHLGSPLWPASPVIYVYDGPQVVYPFTVGEKEGEVTLFPGDEYDVYRVPSADGGEMREWALIVKRRSVSFFIDPANPEAGLIEWEGQWRTLEPAWAFSLSWENYKEVGKLLQPVIGEMWINTVAPPLVAVLLFQVPLAYLGALGIGAVRPLGRRSELLLLPFSPWLFVTAGPLFVTFFLVQVMAGLWDTWASLIPPLALSVPMLFILTLFFKGQAPRWRAAQAEGRPPVRAFFETLVLPSLPLVALLACASLLLGVQDTMWQMVAGHTNRTFNAALLFPSWYALSWPGLVAMTVIFGLPTFIFFFAAFGALQALHLDRLALTSDRPSAAGEGEPPREPAAEETQEV